MTVEPVSSALAILCSVVACVTDVREQRIPNALTFSSAGLGLVLHAGLHGWQGLATSLAGGLTAGILFAVLYALGGMGAGDVKLAAAIGFLMGLPPMGLFLIVTVLSGGLFALVVAIRSGRLRETFRNMAQLTAHHAVEGVRPHDVLSLANTATLRIPYALPIAAGCITAAVVTLRTHAL